jgi:hypothetical protein
MLTAFQRSSPTLWPRGTLLGGILALLGILIPNLAQAAEAVQIEPMERWSNVFGGSDVEFRFTIKVSAAFQGRAIWAVAIDKGAVLMRGEGKVDATPDKPGTLKIKFSAPGREGVTLPVRLVVQVFGSDDKGEKPRATLSRMLWVFPDDPFKDRAEWLKKSKITLFDPAHTTADVLKKAGIPFDEETNQAAIGNLRDGMVVIGEGASFKEEPQLADMLIKLAARGIPVLCLAPSEGMFPLPPAGKADAKATVSLSFRGREVITSLDKRLDATAWAPDGQVVVNSLNLIVSDGSVVAEVVKGEEGWSWLEMEFGPRKGRLIVCGFGIAKSWSKGPTPRYLFAALLERLTEKGTTERDDPKGADK